MERTDNRGASRRNRPNSRWDRRCRPPSATLAALKWLRNRWASVSDRKRGGERMDGKDRQSRGLTPKPTKFKMGSKMSAAFGYTRGAQMAEESVGVSLSDTASRGKTGWKGPTIEGPHAETDQIQDGIEDVGRLRLHSRRSNG